MNLLSKFRQWMQPANGSFALGQQYPKQDAAGFFDPSHLPSSFSNSSLGLASGPIPTADACISLLAETVAQLPVLVIEKGSNYSIVEDHPISELFNRPSNIYGGFTTRSLISSYQHSSGNGVAEIIRNASGDPVQLIPRTVNRTIPATQTSPFMYLINLESGRTKKLFPSKVFHIAGPGLDLKKRLSPSPIKKYFDILSLQSESVSRQRRAMNGLELRHILQPDAANKYSKTQREEILNAFLGSSEKDNVIESTMSLLLKKGFASLPAGFQLKNIGFSSVDLALLDVLGFSSAEVCRIWRVPPALVHVTLPGGQNLKQHPSLSEQWTGFVRGRLLSDVFRWKEEIERKCFTIEEREQYEILIDSHQLTLGTLKDLATALDLLVQKTAVITPNEARKRYLRLLPLPGGDKLRQPTGAPKQGEQDAQ